MSDFDLEENNELDEDNKPGLTAGDLDLWTRPTKQATTADMLLAAADPPREPPTTDDKPKETDKPPTPPPTGEVELPKVTDKQREDYYKANKANIDAMLSHLTPEVRRNEYENRTIYRDISNGLGSSRMKNMLLRATEKGPEEVAKFLAAINHALENNPATKGFSISGDFRVVDRPPAAKQNTCEFTVKRPGTGKADDKHKCEAPYNPGTGPRGSTIPVPMEPPKK